MIMLVCTAVSFVGCTGDNDTDKEQSSTQIQENYDFSGLQDPQNQDELLENVEILANKYLNDVLTTWVNES